MTTSLHKNKWDSVTFRVKSPDGTAFINIMENSPGDIAAIQMSIGKAGTSLNSYCYALAEMATELLHQGKSINDLIVMLTGISSARAVRVAGGVDVRSGPEALVHALMQYRRMIPDTDNGRKPPRFLNRL